VQTTLLRQNLGPVSLVAPQDAPRHVRAAHGHMWQWVGDGEELISLSIAARESRLGTPTGVRHHLSWEVRQVRSDLDPQHDAPSVTRVLVDVDGAVGASAADVLGRVRGVEVHDRIIVMTDGAHMHVVRALVPDTPEGRELSESVTSSLQLHEWSMTS
jgi:hypothetical protein